jgi:hypothetical protein
MDKIQFVQGMYPEDIHFNGLQDSVEKADKTIAAALAGKGVAYGFALSITGDTAQVSPGLGFDETGRAVQSEDPVTVSLADIARPAAGQYKWLALVASFARNSYGDVYDDNNQRHDLYNDESMVLELVPGASGSLEGAVRPDEGDSIIIADILVDSATPFEELVPDYARRGRIVSLLDLLDREAVKRIAVDADGVKELSFASLGLADGTYSVKAQLIGSWPFVRSLGVESIETAVKVYLYNDSYPYKTPVLGAPKIKVGTSPIGEFAVGGRESVPVDLFIRKEEI